MKLPFINPLSVSVLALVGGLATGTGRYLFRARGMVAKVEAVHAKLASEKQRRQQQQAQGWDFWTIEIDNLASELKEEKARLAKRSDELDQRAARLAMEEQDLGKVRSDIESMHRQMEERITTISADESKNLRTLAQTFSNLTPKAAVAILHEMDDVTAVKILSLMKPDVVGPIFEEMAADNSGENSMAHRAAVLSDKLRLLRSTPATPST
jgi:flagellar motility protein MotE (MotC chaperone)